MMIMAGSYPTVSASTSYFFGESPWGSLEAEGKGTKASEGKCGHVKRGVVGRVQSCLGTPSTLCLSSTFKR